MGKSQNCEIKYRILKLKIYKLRSGLLGKEHILDWSQNPLIQMISKLIYKVFD